MQRRTEPDRILRHCEDGHCWTDQGDGTVSPSWGYGGTHFEVADPTRCPEPASTGDHGHACSACGAVWFMGGCPCGSPAAVEPACLKPAVRSRAWSQLHAPWGESPHGCWWVALGGAPERPVLVDGGLSCGWTELPDLIDLETGERTKRLDSAQPGLAVRRIDFDDWPAWLREAWPLDDRGRPVLRYADLGPKGIGGPLSGRSLAPVLERAKRDDRLGPIVRRQLSLDL